MQKVVYALYRGDTFIDMGTTRYLAQLIGVSERTIKFYNTKAYKRRRKDDGNSYVVIRVEDI